MKILNVFNSDKLILVDDEDYIRLKIYTWYIRKGMILRYSYNPLKQNTEATSIAAEIMNNKKILYDHIDRNFLNNQKLNLRPASYSQNSANRGPHKNKISSKYKGVYFIQSRGHWLAQIYKRRSYHLGCFTNEIDAAKAYNIKAKELFGEFAYLNPV